MIEDVSIWTSRLGGQGERWGAYGDLDTVIREDEGGVGGCELGGRHCGRWLVGGVL